MRSRVARFGQMTGNDATALLTKFTQCAQQGLGLDLATGECCKADECIQGWTPDQPLPSVPPTVPTPPDRPRPDKPAPPGGREIPGTGTVIVNKTELDDLNKKSGSRIWYAVIAGLGGAGIGLLAGIAIKS